MTFHSFNVKKKEEFQKFAGLWLAGKMLNRIGIYGSKVAEGLSAFQRRSCIIHYFNDVFNSTQTIMIFTLGQF